MTQSERHAKYVKREAYFALYWADASRWKVCALCHACGLADSAGLFQWGELSDADKAALRAEIMRRVEAIVSEDFWNKFGKPAAA